MTATAPVPPTSPSGPIGESAGSRLALAVVLGAAGAVVGGLAAGPVFAAPVGWDVAAATWLVWTWARVGGMDADATRTHATREDPTKRVTALVLTAAAVASLIAVGVLLVRAGHDHGGARTVVAVVGLVGVALSWTVVHTVFMLRYALLYYGASPPGGIDFNDDQPPRYTDFAYLAFDLGMTYQVSDTSLTGHAMRATVLRHSLLSYVFGSLILASAVNLVVTLAG